MPRMTGFRDFARNMRRRFDTKTAVPFAGFIVVIPPHQPSMGRSSYLNYISGARFYPNYVEGPEPPEHFVWYYRRHGPSRLSETLGAYFRNLPGGRMGS